MSAKEKVSRLFDWAEGGCEWYHHLGSKINNFIFRVWRLFDRV